jgi:hypothetical protein
MLSQLSNTLLLLVVFSVVNCRFPIVHQLLTGYSVGQSPHPREKVGAWIKGITYETTQILAPRARFPIHVEVIEQEDEYDKNKHQASYSNEPPGPPRWFPALEEPNWVFGKPGDSRIWSIAVTGFDLRHGCIWWLVLVDSFPQRIRGMQNANSKHETHEKTSNM